MAVGLVTLFDIYLGSASFRFIETFLFMVVAWGGLGLYWVYRVVAFQ
ncbi:hypothetical protein [Spongiactinospora sp. TRM90649]|nr:hypothetical protein [Spongiactinospora sp. TRM90649]MDF5757829.1 hypothetical protein [Spongiactinospora sp. TRM90649]